MCAIVFAKLPSARRPDMVHDQERRVWPLLPHIINHIATVVPTQVGTVTTRAARFKLGFVT
jgi:hypothetical protein